MRIAYISADPGVPVFGRKGCSIHVQEVLRAMVQRGAQINLFATSTHGRGETNSMSEEKGDPSVVPKTPDGELALTPALSSGRGSGLEKVRLHPLPPAPKGDLGFREQKCLAANAALRSALEHEGPFDLVYERYSLWGFAGMEYAREAGTPGLLEVNAPLIEEQEEHRSLVDRSGAERVRERVFAAAAALLAVSDEVAEHLGGFPATAGKVHVVPNGVDPGRFPTELSASCPAAHGIFTVGFVGSMKPWHGLAGLMEAFAILHRQAPQSRLLLVGEGVMREKLAAEAASGGLADAVHFTGAVAPAEVPGLLASMDVAVAPYPKLANFYFSPLKVYEYMAAGLPVVASRSGQLEKLIDSEVTGLFVSPGDSTALAAALERIRLEPELGARLGRAARAKVFRDHTWDGTVRRILQLAGVSRE